MMLLIFDMPLTAFKHRSFIMSNKAKAKPISNQGNGGNWPTKNGTNHPSGPNRGNSKPKSK